MCLIEILKKMLNLVRCDAHSIVLHHDMEASVFKSDHHPDFSSLRRELQCI